MITTRWQHQPAAWNLPMTLDSSARTAVFQQGFMRREGIDGGLESVANVPLFTLAEGELDTGDVITVDIEDFPLPATSLAEFSLLFYFRGSADQPFVRVPVNTVEIRPGNLARLSVAADSVVRPGDDVNLRVRLEDRYGNLVRDQALRLDLLINGNFESTIEVTSAFQPIEGVVLNNPGLYSLELRTGGGGLRSVSNPIIVESDAQDQVYWLQIGAHGVADDGVLTTEEIYRQGRGHYDLIIPSQHVAADISSSTGEAPQSSNVAASTELISAVQVTEGKTRGAYTRLTSYDGRALSIAMAENPTDARYLTPDHLKLAQVLGSTTSSTVSGYPWMLDRLGQRGYAPGVVAIHHSHQRPGPLLSPTARGYTGLILKPGQDLFTALMAGQTFVSYGEKILLRSETPARPRINSDVVMDLEVTAGSPVGRIELYRNGKIIHVRQGDWLDTAAESSTFILSLASGSEPLGRFASRPRNGREWVGYLSTQDAAVTIDEDARPGWKFQAAGPRRVDFLTHTHGTTATLPFTLSGVTADTVLELGFAESFEDIGWLPDDRLPQLIPAQRFIVPFSELAQGAVRTLNVAGYDDTITLEAQRPALGTQVVVRYRDPQPAHRGDWYVFRVVLTNGHFAWSSPVMVN